MKAIICTKYGLPDALKLKAVREPIPVYEIFGDLCNCDRIDFTESVTVAETNLALKPTYLST